MKIKRNFIHGLRRQAKNNIASFKTSENHNGKFKIQEEDKQLYESDEPKMDPEKKINSEIPEDFDDLDINGNRYGYDNEYKLPPAQKPESFHRFILDNEFRTLEREIRGLKDVWDKVQNKYITKRKDRHCFNDEEAEFILRIAETHLSSSIKLATMTKEQFDIKLMGLYESVETHIREIMEYKFGRFKGFHEQLQMKREAIAIFDSIMANVFANYSRAVEGKEIRYTHDSVKAQESLQQNTDIKQEMGYT
jgi:hypothetical protein